MIIFQHLLTPFYNKARLGLPPTTAKILIGVSLEINGLNILSAVFFIFFYVILHLSVLIYQLLLSLVSLIFNLINKIFTDLNLGHKDNMLFQY
jgi:type IV secretory pathway VirB3-like protein